MHAKLSRINLKGKDYLRDLLVNGEIILNKKFWEELIAYFP
jgi:hypothetical protein